VKLPADWKTLPARAGVAAGIFAFFVVLDAIRIGTRLPSSFFGDEWRYVYYAKNLLHGFYSPRDRIFLWNGPGYPILLVPFALFDWIDGARFANAVWHAGAMVYAWLILQPRLRPQWALGATAALALYIPMDEHLPMLYTEVLCFFLVAAWTYHSLHAEKSWLHVALAAGAFAWLCLTKVIFAYVLLAFSGIALVAWFRTRAVRWKAHLQQAVLALALCMPYLVYTYDLTGKVFYWSSAGASSFYWLSSPYDGEWGDWYHQGWVEQNPVLRAHHKEIFDRTTGLLDHPDLSQQEQMFNLSTPESAAIFAERARQNVREHPLKFAKNWAANVVRTFLDVPVSVRGTPFWNPYSVSHLLLLAWTAFVADRTRRTKAAWPREWTPIAMFAGLGLAALSLSSSMGRFLIPLVPIWWLGSCWVFALANESQSQLGQGAPS
jgi:hypothetical protein